MDWRKVGNSAFTGAAFSGVGSGFGQAVSLECGSQVVGGITSSYFTVGNAVVDITYSAYDATSSRTLVGRTFCGGGGGGSLTQMMVAIK